MHYITKDVPSQQVLKDVGNVLTAFVSKNADNIGYCDVFIY